MESIFPGFPTAARASYVPCTSNAQTSSVESRLASGTNRTEMHRVSRRYPACSLARPDTCGCPGVAPGRLQLWKASYPTVYFCSEIKTSSQRELRSGSIGNRCTRLDCKNWTRLCFANERMRRSQFSRSWISIDVP